MESKSLLKKDHLQTVHVCQCLCANFSPSSNAILIMRKTKVKTSLIIEGLKENVVDSRT
jgi:hypothetical protein